MAVRVVVAGTGTEVGKTYVTCALARWIANIDDNSPTALRGGVLALKPIESGGVADARALSAACGIEHRPHDVFAEPISPHLAARREGRTIRLPDIVGWVSQQERTAERAITLIETAGGLFSPLGPGLTNASMAVALKPAALIVVAADRLGVLHDVTATLISWRAQGYACPVLVVLSAPENADDSTTTNGAELQALQIADVAAEFPRAEENESASAHGGAARSATVGAVGLLAQRVADLVKALR